MDEELKDKEKELNQSCSLGDDIPCPICGGMTIPSGHCRVCINCGSSTGCS
jgi:hypothetical protein